MSKPEVFLFPYTNVFMHFKMFDEVDWPSLVAGAPVVLCLSRTFTKELEEKKYDQKLSSRKRDRVRKVSVKVDQFLETGGAVRAGVRLQIMKHPDKAAAPAGLDISHADDAHVATAHELKRESGADVRMVSGDTNLRHSARSVGLALLSLPDELALPPEPDDAEVELKRLRGENERLKAVPKPKLSVAFSDGTTTMRVPRCDWASGSTADEQLWPALDQLTDALLATSAFAPSRSAMKKYRERKVAYERDVAATACLKLTLFNQGEAPAKGVHLELFFPNEFLVRDADAMPKEPEEPTSAYSFATVVPSIAFKSRDDWSIARSVAELSRRQVVHSLHHELPVLYARPSQADDLSSFQIRGRIVTSEPPDTQEFQLQVVVESEDDGNA